MAIEYRDRTGEPTVSVSFSLPLSVVVWIDAQHKRLQVSKSKVVTDGLLDAMGEQSEIDSGEEGEAA